MRLDIDLGEAVFGVGEGRSPSTPRWLCATCQRRRRCSRAPDPHLRRLRRPRRGAAGAAQLPRPGHDLAPLHDLPGLRPVITAPVLRVLRRRPGAHPPHARPSRCRPGSTPAPASSSPARARSAPAAGPPATSTSRSAVNRARLPAPRRRPARTVERADDGGGAGRHASLETFDGAADLEIAPGTQSGDTITLRGLGVTHLRGTGRGDIFVHADGADPDQARRRAGGAAAPARGAARRGATRGAGRQPGATGSSSASCATRSRLR